VRSFTSRAALRGGDHGGHHATEAGLPGYRSLIKKQTPSSMPLLVRLALLLCSCSCSVY
jgi:hypothetical protein